MNKTPVYLVMVTASNHNKYYKMIPDGDYFNVEYGRIGATCQTARYSMNEWNKKYNEKVKKGYVDQSDMIQDLIEEEKSKGPKEFKDIENKVIALIVERLQDMARKTIQKHYKIGEMAVTQAMVDKAQAHIDKMSKKVDKMTLKAFNDELLVLFGIIPRKMKEVNDFLASKKDEMKDILGREQDLLDVMKGQVVQRIVTENNDNEDNTVSNQTVLQALGVEMEEVTDEEVEHIKELMGEAKNMFKQAWRVKNLETQKAFDEFIAKENITEIKELWHGSNNANWWSIYTTGLKIYPAKSAANGRMLGNGIYTSNEAMKAVTYSSVSSYNYSRETSGFLAILDVAYGKPYDIYAFDPKYYDFDFDKLQAACPGANCLHAHKGMNTGWCNLRRDEIVVYKPQQQTIKYLVEIKKA